MNGRKIKNMEALATTEARRKLLSIVDAGLQAIDTAGVIRDTVSFDGATLSVAGKEYDLADAGRVVVVGVGKCSLDAVREIERILGERLDEGVVLDIWSDGTESRVKSFKGDHPYPTEANRAATAEIVNVLKPLSERDVAICVVSGGGTVLLCQPNGFTCESEADLVRCLFHAGITIQGMNTVRKHLSTARGGYLAAHAYPARVISLIFSDVPGNDLATVASGPTVKDETTVEDAKAVVQKLQKSGCDFDEGYLIETPKDDKYFERVDNILLLSNETALNAMAEEGKRLGLDPVVCGSCLEGEARIVGESLVRELRGAAPKTLLLYGGETTVRVGNLGGKGGRNQELVLSALRDIQHDETIASVASDGIDNSPVAGALCDTILNEASKKLNLQPDEYLRTNNSFNFFEKAGGHIITGSTGSNVSDLVIGIKE